MDLLAQITELSREFGSIEYVRGGGGNTSAKTADTLWVKPSGMMLSSLAPTSFVAMDRAKLARLYTMVVPADATAREALVKDMMAAAVKPDQTARPSVEAPLHDILSGTFVVHTHATLVNGMTCAQRGREVCERLFPEVLWVSYIDPGFTLCMDVRQGAAEYNRWHGRAPTLLILESHGIFVTGDTANEIRGIYNSVMQALRTEYRSAGVSTELTVTKPASPTDVEATKHTLQELLGNEAAGIASYGTFAVAPGPISPDHIVYAKSFPYDGPLTRAGIDAFRVRRGYTPLIYVTPSGVYAIGTSQKKADLALELALDGALVCQLAKAFGGIQFLTDAACEFIEHWEVESYRQQQTG